VQAYQRTCSSEDSESKITSNLKEKVVVRNFVKPKLNFKAAHYTDMIDWKD